jgi:hypothetical protein
MVERLYIALGAGADEPVIYFNPADPVQSYGYSTLRRVPPVRNPLTASGHMEALKKLWADGSVVRM